jgi:hypothetical protein
LKNSEKKKPKKSFSTVKFRPNGQIFSIGISPIPPLVVEIRPEYGKNTANASTDPQGFFLELFLASFFPGDLFGCADFSVLVMGKSTERNLQGNS